MEAEAQREKGYTVFEGLLDLFHWSAPVFHLCLMIYQSYVLAKWTHPRVKPDEVIAFHAVSLGLASLAFIWSITGIANKKQQETPRVIIKSDDLTQNRPLLPRDVPVNPNTTSLRSAWLLSPKNLSTITDDPVMLFPGHIILSHFLNRLQTTFLEILLVTSAIDAENGGRGWYGFLAYPLAFHLLDLIVDHAPSVVPRFRVGLRLLYFIVLHVVPSLVVVMILGIRGPKEHLLLADYIVCLIFLIPPFLEHLRHAERPSAVKWRLVAGPNISVPATGGYGAFPAAA